MPGTDPASAIDRVALTIDLVLAYIANNRVPSAELPTLIAAVHASLTGLVNPSQRKAAGPSPRTSTQVRHSITPEGLISFEDGKSYKLLSRHLRQRGLSPEAYRTKWGLPHDYPMTTSSYSAMRSELARRGGLGQKRQAPATAVVEVEKPLAALDTAKARGRRSRTGARTASVMAE